MIKKVLRTRAKYIKAAAELDLLDKCLFEMNNVKSLLPANESDKIEYIRHKILAKYKGLLERQAAKPLAGKEKFDEFPVSEIYYKWDRKKDETYKARLAELKAAIFRTEEKQ